MKCLTVCQPFAYLILQGDKRIENRTWPTRYRGPLLIHAGASHRFLGGADDRLIPNPDALVFGAIIGLVDLIDCVSLQECRDERFAEGPWCWRVVNPRPLEPFPCRGKLLLWQSPPGFALPAALRRRESP